MASRLHDLRAPRAGRYRRGRRRGESSYAIAARFGVAASAVQRHARRHLSAALAGMLRSEQARRAGPPCSTASRASLNALRRILQRRGSATAGRSQALAVLKELRGLLELLGKATGELDTRPVTVVNLRPRPSGSRCVT